jgi:hypothetical protein
VIRIRAEDSPNVILAHTEIAAGKKPSGKIVVPGVKQYWEYRENRNSWDAHQQCVSLDADWYEGADVKMYPADWLNYAKIRAREIVGQRREAKAIGVDTGEGSAETSICVVDELGVIELQSRKTPDTSIIPGWVLALAIKYSVPPERISFDAGGGGYEHACVLRKQGYAVRTVPFGTPLVAEKRMRGLVKPLKERVQETEEHYVYKNRRAQMYHLLRLKLDPNNGGFAISREYIELRRQLAPIPLRYDGEGRIYLPPKQLKPGDEDGSKETIIKLVGCSPDQADSLVLAVYTMLLKKSRYKVTSLV